MLWQIALCYGCPEAIEAFLFIRLENFPKHSDIDYQRLQELGDLLLEIEAAKLDGYLPGRSFLDTATGINNIQEQCIGQGSRY